MSHDFAFWNSAEPLESEEAAAIYADLVERGESPRVRPSPQIGLLAEAVRDRWPVLAPGREDDWPLSAPPDESAGHLIVSIAASRLWDVWPGLGELAKSHELVMYDPQQRHVFLPPRLSRQRTRVRAQAKRGQPPAGSFGT